MESIAWWIRCSKFICFRFEKILSNSNVVEWMWGEFWKWCCKLFFKLLKYFRKKLFLKNCVKTFKCDTYARSRTEFYYLSCELYHYRITRCFANNIEKKSKIQLDLEKKNFRRENSVLRRCFVISSRKLHQRKLFDVWPLSNLVFAYAVAMSLLPFFQFVVLKNISRELFYWRKGSNILSLTCGRLVFDSNRDGYQSVRLLSLFT